MKKAILLLGVFLVIVLVGLGLKFFNQKEFLLPLNKNQEEEIIVFSPQPNQTVNSPLIIKGKARGYWFFEASFPVKLLDENEQEIAIGIAETTDDWMTSNFVPFKSELNFPLMKAKRGKLILQKDNPSGLPEYDKQIEIPLQFNPAETLTVKVFFNNNDLDPEFSCNKVFPVEREIVKIPKSPEATGIPAEDLGTQALARASLEELLKGVSEKERLRGYFSNLNAGVKIQKLTIENSVAKVDFDEQLEYQIGGSCRVGAIRAQISETLKQFPMVKEAIISINGRTEDILQP